MMVLNMRLNNLNCWRVECFDPASISLFSFIVLNPVCSVCVCMPVRFLLLLLLLLYKRNICDWLVVAVLVLFYVRDLFDKIFRRLTVCLVCVCVCLVCVNM